MTGWNDRMHGSISSDAPRIAILRTECSAKALGPALEARGARVLELPLSSCISGELGRFEPDTILTGLCSSAPCRVLDTILTLDRELFSRSFFLLLIPEIRVETLRPCFEAGVDDVVSPPHSASTILLRRWIQLRTRERRALIPRIRRELRLGSLLIDVPRRHLTGGGSRVELSGREFELLLQLLEAEGELVSREDLLHRIWGQRGESEAVLDATVHRLRRKLDRAGSEGSRVATVRGSGYRLELDHDATPTELRRRSSHPASGRVGAGARRT